MVKLLQSRNIMVEGHSGAKGLTLLQPRSLVGREDPEREETISGFQGVDSVIVS